MSKCIIGVNIKGCLMYFLHSNFGCINPLQCSFGIDGHAALDIKLAPGYNNLLVSYPWRSLLCMSLEEI